MYFQQFPLYPLTCISSFVWLYENENSSSFRIIHEKNFYSSENVCLFCNILCPKLRYFLTRNTFVKLCMWILINTLSYFNKIIWISFLHDTTNLIYVIIKNSIYLFLFECSENTDADTPTIRNQTFNILNLWSRCLNTCNFNKNYVFANQTPNKIIDLKNEYFFAMCK